MAGGRLVLAIVEIFSNLNNATILKKHLLVVTRRLPATIRVVWMQIARQGRDLFHRTDLNPWLLLYFLAVVILIQ